MKVQGWYGKPGSRIDVIDRPSGIAQVFTVELHGDWEDNLLAVAKALDMDPKRYLEQAITVDLVYRLNNLKDGTYVPRGEAEEMIEGC